MFFAMVVQSVVVWQDAQSIFKLSPWGDVCDNATDVNMNTDAVTSTLRTLLSLMPQHYPLQFTTYFGMLL